MQRLVPHAVVLLLALAVPAAAQVVERPSSLITSAGITELDLIATPNGFMIVFDEPSTRKHVFARRFDPQGVPVRDATFDAPDSDEPVVALDSLGGFIAAWRQAVWSSKTTFRPGLFMRRLDAFGEGLGKSSWVSGDGAFANSPSVAGLPSGSLLLWYDFGGMFARRYSRSGRPLGDPVLVDDQGGESTILPTADGATCSCTGGTSSATSTARSRCAPRPSGELRAEATVSDDFDFTDAALAPAEDVVAAVGIDVLDPDLPPTDVVVQRFALDGTLVGGRVVVHSAPDGVTGPQVAFDQFGNLLVTWGENGGVWARVLDGSGTRSDRRSRSVTIRSWISRSFRGCAPSGSSPASSRARGRTARMAGPTSSPSVRRAARCAATACARSRARPATTGSPTAIRCPTLVAQLPSRRVRRRRRRQRRGVRRRQPDELRRVQRDLRGRAGSDLRRWRRLARLRGL
jgi:hypothetical protein